MRKVCNKTESPRKRLRVENSFQHVQGLKNSTVQANMWWAIAREPVTFRDPPLHWSVCDAPQKTKYNLPSLLGPPCGSAEHVKRAQTE